MEEPTFEHLVTGEYSDHQPVVHEMKSPSAMTLEEVEHELSELETVHLMKGTPIDDDRRGELLKRRSELE